MQCVLTSQNPLQHKATKHPRKLTFSQLQLLKRDNRGYQIKFGRRANPKRPPGHQIARIYNPITLLKDDSRDRGCRFLLVLWELKAIICGGLAVDGDNVVVGLEGFATRAILMAEISVSSEAFFFLYGLTMVAIQSTSRSIREIMELSGPKGANLTLSAFTLFCKPILVNRELTTMS